MYDIIIIGAGIAGMTAAIYATRAGKTVLVLENGAIGGQIIQAHDVRNWPGASTISGEQLTKNILKQAKSLGAQFEFDTIKTVKAEKSQITVIGEEKTYRSHSLIIATGSREKKLGLPEEADYLGHGLSYCVTCDGTLFKDQDVAVVGGGNTAFYDALYLANLAHRVYLIHHTEHFRADAALVEKVKNLPNVELLLNRSVLSLTGDGQLEEILLGLEPNTQTDAESETEPLTVSGLFVAIGREPATDLFQDLVETDSDGYIIAGEDCATSRPGIFVAGDCRTKSVRQLVTAAADGATAATAAVNYLNQ